MYPYLYNADDMLRDIRMGDLEKDVLVARSTLAKVSDIHGRISVSS